MAGYTLQIRHSIRNNLHARILNKHPVRLPGHDARLAQSAGRTTTNLKRGETLNLQHDILV